MTGYVVVTCRLAEGCDELLAELLGEHEVLGARIESCGDGLVSVEVYLASAEVGSTRDLARALTDLGGIDVTVDRVPERDWLEEYRRQARPFAVGARWWIDPTAEATSTPPPGRIALSVEPSCAFGSGSHESTQLMLIYLEARGVLGQSVLDVGTGSGILTIAASRLGADRVVGVDVEPRAVFVARSSLLGQAPSVPALLVAGSLDAVGGEGMFDTVMCNMLWESQQPLLPDLRRVLARDGDLVLSGFLKSDERAIVASLGAAHLSVVGRRELGDWLLLEARHG